MPLDSTRIAVRERSHVEIIDMTLHVLRAHAGPLLKTGLIGVLPFLVLDYFLVGWIPVLASEELVAEDYSGNSRYYYLLALLVMLQAPLATTLMTVYLGQAVFVARPTIKQVLRDTAASRWALFWTLGLWRLTLPGSLMLLIIAGSEEMQMSLEVGLFGSVAALAAIQRAFWPYLPEIVLLEKNPLLSRNADVVTVNKRSRRLHAGGDLFSRWLASVVVNIILVYMTFQLALFFQGVFLNNWHYATPWMIYVAYPLALWVAAGFTATCRFLSYLDTRIRNEGWEVDLLLRAETARLREAPWIG